MTHLTDNVQSIGPHPATRTEFEARADKAISLIANAACTLRGLDVKFDQQPIMDGIARSLDCAADHIAALKIARGEKP